MKISEKDVQLFKELKTVGITTSLIDFWDRLSSWVCDIRNMEGLTNEDIKARSAVINLIEEHWINKMRNVETEISRKAEGNKQYE